MRRPARLLALVLAAAALAPATAAASPWTTAVTGTGGLADLWRLGETSGLTAADSAGTSPGTWTGSGVTLGAGGAIAADTDTAVTLGGGGALALGSAFSPAGDFGLEAWVRPTTSSGTRYVLSKGSGSSGFHLLLNTAGAPVFTLTTTAWTYSLTGVPLATGVWHHLAATLAGPTMTLYVDGRPAASQAVSGTPKTTSYALYAGRYSASWRYGWVGDLDELAVYRQALSAAQVAAHYAAGVDATLPRTTLSGGPPPRTGLDSATFALTASTSPVTFACALDGAAWSACGPTVSLTSLAYAAHTLAVRAVDRWGQTEATPVTASWTMDPLLAPDYDPAGPHTTITASVGAFTSRTDATFTLASSSAGSTFTCTLDGRALTPCGSSVTLHGLTQGAHTLRVRATDRFGQAESSPPSFTWTVDTTAPDTWALVVVQAGQGLVTPAASEDGATFQCRAGTGAWVPCAAGFAVPATAANALAVRAIDRAGNVDAAPATVTMPASPTPAGGALAFSSTDAAFAFAASRGAAFTCSLDGAAFAACTSPAQLTGLHWGDHAFVVRAAFSGGGPTVDAAPVRWTAASPQPQLAALQFPLLVRRSRGGVSAQGRRPALRFALNVAVRVRVTVRRASSPRGRPVATWTVAGRAGDNRVVLPALLARTLRRGRYRIAAQPAGAPARTAAFAVV